MATEQHGGRVCLGPTDPPTLGTLEVLDLVVYLNKETPDRADWSMSLLLPGGRVTPAVRSPMSRSLHTHWYFGMLWHVPGKGGGPHLVRGLLAPTWVRTGRLSN